MSGTSERQRSEPVGLRPRPWEPSNEHPLPTRRRGEILPPGASRR